MKVHDGRAEQWTVTLVDTGENTMTGGRLAAVAQYVKDEDAFCFTYCDGVSDIDIGQSIAFHKNHGKMVTVTAVHPVARFGKLVIEGDQVVEFQEKPQTDLGWINGGFFVFEPEFLNLLKGDSTILEREPLEQVAKMGQLKAYIHNDFWQCMDTKRDRDSLEEMWQSGKPLWKI